MEPDQHDTTLYIAILYTIEVPSFLKSCSKIFQLHMIPDYVSIVYRVTC